jgi:hypothetical protein
MTENNVVSICIVKAMFAWTGTVFFLAHMHVSEFLNMFILCDIPRKRSRILSSLENSEHLDRESLSVSYRFLFPFYDFPLISVSVVLLIVFAGLLYNSNIDHRILRFAGFACHNVVVALTCKR